ncbi:assimilatory sulfite reductase (NADPH) hemoprotein subunit [Brackiella oedipodis]|uniref:assimilatory sulfite reductase (NADPH) hemoprotein subunit n=1 Tax=Brackiella oedipodis TaxID=124225 RepID=UPI000491D0A9|nr:assimilatory sulfite reductase (NADPH) hemoprotein subunit [Brackiella oedipodis]
MSTRVNDPRTKLDFNKPLNDDERMKAESDYLHGTIAEDLKDGLTGGFRGDNYKLIRYHGMYEQDDRDLRADRVAAKLEPRKTVMLRCRLPGGILTPEQWLTIDKFADEHSFYQSIRLTNRQTFQYHGVLKKDIKPMMQMLHSIGLDSIASSGDVNRNTLCATNPRLSRLHAEVYDIACRVSKHLLPNPTAYADIWLDGEKVFPEPRTKPQTKQLAEDKEPIMGKTYMPRKFKTAFVIPPQNDVDVHANDLNFLAVHENGKLFGFNVLVGGGLAFDFGNKETFPILAHDFGFIPVDLVFKAAEAVMTVQRDWGNRAQRKLAKTRYTILRVGVDVFKAEVEKRMESQFAPVHPYEFTHRGDDIGWTQGEDKRWHLTLFIESGRLIDKQGGPALKTGMREIAKLNKGEFRITPNQNLIVSNIEEADKAQIESIAKAHGLIVDELTEQRKNSMSCVALPTCPLAMAESERVLPSVVSAVEQMLAANGLAHEHIILRIQGCNNGCGRAMLAEIGLVGKAIGRYNLHVGGNKKGTRIPKMFKENIPLEECLAIIETWIKAWAQERQDQEEFGDFAIRTGIIAEIKDSAVDFWAA